MRKSGFIRKKMEERLRRAGVHPADIETAANFVERAVERDREHAAKNTEKGAKEYEQPKGN